MTSPLDFTRARFLQSAPTLALCPCDHGAEVAFAGRSNAGKSSAINALARSNKLARTSKTPGRTQLINFFGLDPQRRLVDLPGYGFAKVPRAVKANWDRHLADYLQGRKSLKGLILLMDIRHPLQDYDWQMLRWARAGELPVHILLTKADKLNRGPAGAALMAVGRELKAAGLAAWASVQTFSSPTRNGLEQLQSVISQWLAESEDTRLTVES